MYVCMYANMSVCIRLSSNCKACDYAYIHTYIHTNNTVYYIHTYVHIMTSQLSSAGNNIAYISYAHTNVHMFVC